jgi:hypothetical protein
LLSRSPSDPDYQGESGIRAIYFACPIWACFPRRLVSLSTEVRCCSSASHGPGAVATTTQFTAIANASFIDLPASSFLTPVSAAGVTITASNDADGSFFNFPAGTADAPGSGDGFLNFNHDLFTNVSPLTLNFSAPVASFGVSFQQMPPSSEGGAFSSPDTLKVFDGANGTGNLLGTVTSSGFLPAGDPTGQHSFVAVLSGSANIRSAVLVGTGPSLGFAVDGYALSVTPQGAGADH